MSSRETFASTLMLRSLACALVMSATLSACGGGGGGGGGGGSPPAPTYTVGGTAAGLSGTGLVLQNSGGNNLSVTANGAFTFPTGLATGAAYAVTVQTQPLSPMQTCVVANGAGSVGGANVANVTVTCTTNSFAVGGTVSGLATGVSVVLQNNAGGNLTVSANGNFAFAAPVLSGGTYAVTVLTQPSSPAQTCTLANASGTVGVAAITNVAVSCSTRTLSVGGTVSGLAGTGLVLQNNAANNLIVAANGSFTFAAAVASGSAYAVTVLTQPVSPTQSCLVTSGTGTIAAANVTNVAVVCTTSSFAVGGTVSGLSGAGLTLRNNGGASLAISANGSFSFPAQVLSGGAYAVTLVTQPSSPTQVCTLANTSGTVGAAAVTNVTVTCVTASFTIGGTVSGLPTGASVVLRNNGGDDKTVALNGAFTFTTPLQTATAYAVTVFTQPASAAPSRNCRVSAGGTGTVGTSNITSVVVNCSTSKYIYGVSNLGGDGIRTYEINVATGALTEVQLYPLAGAKAVTVAATPDGRYVFVGRRLNTTFRYMGTVEVYRVDLATGALTFISTFALDHNGPNAGYPQKIVVHPNGQSVYVMDWQPNIQGEYRVFDFNAVTGVLTDPLVLPPFINGAVDAALDPLGRFAYTASFDAPSLGSFTIPANRELTPAPGSPVNAWPNFTEVNITVDPTGRFLYSSNEDALQVKAYAINQTTAALTQVNPGPAGEGISTDRPPAPSASPAGLVVDSTSRFLYVGLKNGTIQAYAINATSGALSGIGDVSSSAGSASGGLSIAMDASGRFLYFVNYGPLAPLLPAISLFSVNSITGALTEVTPALSTGGSVSGIAIP
jgi:6-phosphogluconolactonase (cycloisomerase 2 family)